MATTQKQKELEAAPLVSSVNNTDGEDIPIELIQEERTQGFWPATFNLMNAIVGSGILALPFTMRYTGIILFGLLLTGTAVIANIGIVILLALCNMSGVRGYEDLGLAAFGRPGEIVVCIAVLIQNFGSMTSYLLVAGDVMPNVMGRIICPDSPLDCNSIGADRAFLMCVITACIILPLSLLRRIKSLGWASMVSISVICFFVAVLIVSAATTIVVPVCEISKVQQCAVQYFLFNNHLFFALPTMSFSFVCHTALLPVYTELKEEYNMQTVANTAIGICWVIYFSGALFAYLTFFQVVDTDVLDSFPPTVNLVTVMGVGFASSVALTVPIIHYPARRAINRLRHSRKALTRDFNIIEHVIQTTLTIGVILALAIFVPNIEDVFAVVGASSSVSIMMIIPGILYFKMTPDQSPFSWKRGGALFFAICGVGLGAACLTAVISSFAHGKQS